MKICVIGAGRVGLPLALTISKKHNVSLCDSDEYRLDMLKEGKAPFDEPGLSIRMPLIGDQISLHVSPPTDQDAYVICVPTNIDKHGDIDLSHLFDAIDTLLMYSDALSGSLLIIRSTIEPGTIEMLESYIYNFNVKYGHSTQPQLIAYCPERIAEGHAFDELVSLPQIIGAVSDEAFFLASDVFSFATTIVRALPIEAELAKVFTNTYRYAHFAISNYLATAALKYDVDPKTLFDKMKLGYPRLTSLPNPGLTGGVCLRKDWAMVNNIGYGPRIASEAHEMNEAYAGYIAQLAIDSTMTGRIGILGVSFKSNSDDLRDSLVFKIARTIMHKTGVAPIIHDPHFENYAPLNDGSIYTFNMPLERFFDESNTIDTIIIGANHSEFLDERYKHALVAFYVIDPSGATMGKVITREWPEDNDNE